MTKSFKISRITVLEGLAPISKAVMEACKYGDVHLIIDDESRTVQTSAAFLKGLVAEYNKGKKLECPVCGGTVSKVETFFGDDGYVCEKCRKHLPSEMFQGKAYFISEQGVANFVGKTIGEFEGAQDMGDGNYRLGTFCGREAFFCAAPKEGFFNSFSKDTLIVTCDDSSVPRGWATNGCMVVRFAELFYMKPGAKEIRVADGVLRKVKDKVRPRRFDKNRLIHKRRDNWLSVIMNILSEKYRESDFRDGMLTGAAALRWFRKLFPKVKGCARTFSRDIGEFATYDRKNDQYDKREPLIVNLLKYAANENIPLEDRVKTAKAVATVLAQAKEGSHRNGGVPVELPETSWGEGADGKSERVLTVSGETVYAKVDSNLEKEARGEKAA